MRRRPTRREVIRHAAAAGLAGGPVARALTSAVAHFAEGRAAGAAAALSSGDRRPGGATAPDSTNQIGGADRGRSMLVETAMHRRQGAVLNPSEIRDMLEAGLTALCERPQAADAWHSILRADDVVGVKFNQVAARVLGTNEPLAMALVESLGDAGWPPDRIVLLEADPTVERRLGTRAADLRYSANEIDFGCGRDSFVAALDQVTAIINVPFFKTHHMAVMTGCLKNLSHGLIRHPARFHADGCDPAIARINASEPIRSRVRLHLVNALRVICDGGSRASIADVEDYGRLVLSRDGVAADAYGFQVLHRVRDRRGLSPLLPNPRVPSYFKTAAGMGLGEYDGEYWRCMKVEA